MVLHLKAFFKTKLFPLGSQTQISIGQAMPSLGGNGGKKQSQFLDFPEKNSAAFSIPEFQTLISLPPKFEKIY